MITEDSSKKNKEPTAPQTQVNEQPKELTEQQKLQRIEEIVHERTIT